MSHGYADINIEDLQKNLNNNTYGKDVGRHFTEPGYIIDPIPSLSSQCQIWYCWCHVTTKYGIVGVT